MSNQSFKDPILWRAQVVIVKIASPVNLVGGRGDNVRGVVSITKLNVNCVLKGEKGCT